MTHRRSQEVWAKRAGKLIALRYDIVAYSAFFVTILYAIGFVMDMAVPTSIDAGFRTSSAEAFIANLVLLSLFAIQYSAMARSRNSECNKCPGRSGEVPVYCWRACV